MKHFCSKELYLMEKLWSSLSQKHWGQVLQSRVTFPFSCLEMFLLIFKRLFHLITHIKTYLWCCMWCMELTCSPLTTTHNNRGTFAAWRYNHEAFLLVHTRAQQHWLLAGCTSVNFNTLQLQKKISLRCLVITNTHSTTPPLPLRCSHVQGNTAAHKAGTSSKRPFEEHFCWGRAAIWCQTTTERVNESAWWPSSHDHGTSSR